MTEQTTAPEQHGRHAAPEETLSGLSAVRRDRTTAWRREAAETRSGLRNPELARPRGQ